ncbi:MAG: adenylate cyclase [Verrucomicrobia bacterium]|nr:adenylate cyclase [Verrucomicrobiota bacterium]
MPPSYREIERKFLVRQPPDTAGVEFKLIEQGYLVISSETGRPIEIRLRRVNRRKTELTVKSKPAGQSRIEVEIPVDEGQFDALWPLTAGRRIVKRRYPIPLSEGLLAEYDNYEEKLTGLKVVEVEFPDEEQARRFNPPPWFGREVSGDPAYSNAELATAPHGLPPDHA